jgi:hypothetical protein
VAVNRATHRLGDDQTDLCVGGQPSLSAGMYDEI